MNNIVKLVQRRPLSRSLLELTSIDVTWFTKAAEGLLRVDYTNREEFSQWVYLVCCRLGPAEVVATEFGVSPATLSRWMSGHNVPPVYARQAVLQKLSELALNRAQELPKIA